MKTFDSDNDKSANSYSESNEITGFLIDNPVTLHCDSDLIKSYNVSKSTPMASRGYFYEDQRVLAKNNITQDFRSQSLPNCVDNKNNQYNDNVGKSNHCDTQSTLLLQHHDKLPLSPSTDLWFKTWPERYEKLKNDYNSNKTSNTHFASETCDISVTNGVTKNKLSLEEALQNISLAYSPVTKQLHLVEEETECKDDNPKVEVQKESKTLGHRRTEAGSFSSTVSSLSDPSPSGSLLDAEERSLYNYEDTGAKPKKKKSLGNFFARNVFTWKSSPSYNSSLWKLFGKSEAVNSFGSPQHEGVVASSTALIQHMRPSSLPAKTLEEEQRHREEYKAMVAAAKKKEAQNTANRQKLHKLQLQQEEQLAAATKHFQLQVLPNWESMCNTRKTREFWWQGLPSSVRGKVWRLAIGNELNLTAQLYEICLSRAQNRLNGREPESQSDSIDFDQESSMDVIRLDIARTFPHLCIFQEGGPYSDVLHSLLAAYVCYRPDVGYVQGMSYIAAILILNMEQYDAFICFANLLNRPLHLAAFTLNQAQMQAYYNAYNEIFNYNLPKLYLHFQKSGLTPDLYLLDWIYTIFAKAMPLDVACRIWDIFLRDGDVFIFRTAVGILHLNQDILIQMDFLRGAQFLTRLPDDLSAEQLFKSIQLVNTTIGKETFSQIVDRCSVSIVES